jgi:hypothetical protein
MNKPRPPLKDSDVETEFNSKPYGLMTKLHLREILSRGSTPYPYYLYKYLSSEAKIEHIRSILIESDLYLNSRTQFNDPFDTTAYVIENYNPKELRKKFENIVKIQSGQSNKKLQAIEASKMMETQKNNPNFIKDTLIKNVNQIGIHSLTEKFDNILMWSHYANNHKGMVLEFDIAEDFETFKYALKIEYSEEYPTYNFLDKNENEFKGLLLRKAKGWEYEKEWRIVRTGGAFTYQTFKPKALTSIIFGCRAEPKFIYSIIEILNEREKNCLPKVSLKMTDMHGSKYELVVKNI